VIVIIATYHRVITLPCVVTPTPESQAILRVVSLYNMNKQSNYRLPYICCSYSHALICLVARAHDPAKLSCIL